MKIVGFVLLFISFKRAHGKILYCSQRADAGQLNLLLKSNLFDFPEDFFTLVDSRYNSIVEFSLVHVLFPFFHR